MKYARRFYLHMCFVAMAAASVTGFSSCGGGFNLFSSDYDAQLGKEVDMQIRSTPAQFPLLNDANANSYLQGIVNRIIQTGKVAYADKFPYRVEVIRDDNTVNAFATPGGYIYVYTGLIKMLDNEAAMAGILGHEIAHAAERHSTEQLSKVYGTEMLISIALGSNPSQTAQLAAQIADQLIQLGYSRDAEEEADQRSFDYLRNTQWYAGGAALFFEKVQNSGSGPEFLSTHPNPSNRIADMQRRVQEAGLPGPNAQNLNADAYQRFKSSLRY